MMRRSRISLLKWSTYVSNVGKMKLDDAIQHAEDVALQCRLDSPLCSEDHTQLARWLRELKKYQEIYGEIPPVSDQKG